MSKIIGSFSRIASFLLGAPALGSDAAILADTAMAETETTVVTAFAAQPAVARTLTVKGNHADVAGNVVIAGLNIGGEPIVETIALAGTGVVAGLKAFAAVTAITLPTWVTANTERVRVGTGAALGLPVKLTRDSIVNAFLNGTREATRPTVTFHATQLENNKVTLNSALAGTAVIVDLYETLAP